MYERCLYIHVQSAAIKRQCGSSMRVKRDQCLDLTYASVNSKRQHPPGELFEAVESPTPGQNFSAEARPPGQKSTHPREYYRRSSQTFLLVGVEILEFCRNQTLKRVERLSNYSLLTPSGFSLSTILYHFKVSPQL